MDSGEPALKPQWLRHSGGGSNDQSLGLTNKSRLTSQSEQQQDWRSFSSCKRGSNTNGPRGTDRESSLSKSRAYSNFSSRSSRSRDREKDLGSFDRDAKSGFPLNGFHDRFDPLASSHEKDSGRRSRSLVPGRTSDTWPDGAKNRVSSGAALKTSISGASFEREFPSLVVDEKNGHVETSRASSMSCFESISLGHSMIGGVENWNSVLAEVPTVVTNELHSGSYSMPINQMPPPPSSPGISLNMAEAVVQGPLRARTPPQSIETQKSEDARKYISLVPVAALPTKVTAAVTPDKLKNKGGIHLLNQHNNAVRVPTRAEAAKPGSQAGTLRILTREKNSGPLLSRDGPSASNSPASISPVVHFKSPKGSTAAALTQSPFLDKKSLELAKERHKFFDVIRSQSLTSSAPASEASDGGSPMSGHASLVDAAESDYCENENGGASIEDLKHSDHDVCVGEDGKRSPCFELIPVDPEEAAFLHSLGWNENEDVEPITEEDVEAFRLKLSAWLQRPRPARM